MRNQILKKSIVGEVILSYSKTNQIPSRKLNSSRDSEEFIREFFPINQIIYREFVYVLLLNRTNKVLGYFQLSSGGISGTVIDPKLVFQSALLANSSSIILCHNHPSNSTNPSEPDIQITEKIKLAGQILELPLLDHIIITETSYYSFADEGKL